MASRIRVGTDVEVRGPLFEGRDGPIMRAFFTDAKRIVAEAGEREVKARVNRRAKNGTGAFAGSVRTFDYKKGRTIMAGHPQVLYGPWLEGTSARNASTRFKGYKVFRLTRTKLRREVTTLIQGRYNQAIAELHGGM